VLYFLCVDSTGEHETGEPRKWTNKITIKHRIYDKDDNKVAELKAAPHATILYTTDGSNPKEYGLIYNSEIIIPPDATYLLAVAEAEGELSEPLKIRIDQELRGTPAIDKQRPLALKKRYKTNDTADTYNELELLKKHQAQITDVVVMLYRTEEDTNRKSWIEIQTDSSTRLDIGKLEDTIDNVRENFMCDGRVDITFEYGMVLFKSGQHFMDWVADSKKSLNQFKEEEIVQ
jgi:hypothetical protein